MREQGCVIIYVQVSLTLCGFALSEFCATVMRCVISVSNYVYAVYSCHMQSAWLARHIDESDQT